MWIARSDHERPHLMRIVYVYDAVFPYVTGGAERRIHELGTRLALRGHEVHVVGWQYWDGNPNRMEDGLFLHGVGHPPPLYDANGKRTFRAALSFTRAAAPVIARLDPDVLECSSIPYLPTFLSRFVAAWKRIPLAVCWHEYMGARWREYAGRRAVVASLVERASAQLGTRRIAVSEFTARRLPPGPAITIVPNGVRYDEIASVQPSPDRFDVVFAGRLVPHKRVDLLLDALALVPDLTAVVVGDGPERLKLEMRAQGLGLGDRVRFLGTVEHSRDVYGLFRSANVVVVPSEQEGFGMTVVEAQAAGTPPVAVRAQHSAAAELIEDGVDGVATDSDPAALADGITRIVRDRNLNARVRRAGRISARSYDWAAIATRVEEVYAELTRVHSTSEATPRRVWS
jgi:L-malate glycosyltransferase